MIFILPNGRLLAYGICHLLFTFLMFGFGASAAAEGSVKLNIGYLSQEQAIPPALSNLDAVITDKGIQGARLAIGDNNTTGQFTGQQFEIKEVRVPIDGDVDTAFADLVETGYQHILAQLPASLLAEIAGSKAAANTVIYDVATHDDSLRRRICSTNVLHLLPSRAMRGDALGQYLMKKRWRKWFLVVGPSQEDRFYAAAIKRAAKRFGMQIVAEKAWTHTYDARRTAQADVPVFTQGVDYDVLVVADEAGLFGEYLAYRTWIPRPVVGTQGLVPTSWHRTHEQWGAVQLQNRFREQAGRWMVEEDYAAWLAVRAMGESATRTQSVDFEKLKGYLFSQKLALAGFKGKKLSFRSWNGQLRQPILLAADRSMVSVAPIEGFLHPKNELDTLGFDEPEVSCEARK